MPFLKKTCFQKTLQEFWKFLVLRRSFLGKWTWQAGSVKLQRSTFLRTSCAVTLHCFLNCCWSAVGFWVLTFLVYWRCIILHFKKLSYFSAIVNTSIKIFLQSNSKYTFFSASISFYWESRMLNSCYTAFWTHFGFLSVVLATLKN
jgi:hypothetical protein